MSKIAATIFLETRKSYFPLLKFLTVELTKYTDHHKRYSSRKKKILSSDWGWAGNKASKATSRSWLPPKMLGETVDQIIKSFADQY